IVTVPVESAPTPMPRLTVFTFRFTLPAAEGTVSPTQRTSTVAVCLDPPTKPPNAKRQVRAPLGSDLRKVDPVGWLVTEPAIATIVRGQRTLDSVMRPWRIGTFLVTVRTTGAAAPAGAAAVRARSVPARVSKAKRRIGLLLRERRQASRVIGWDSSPAAFRAA